MFIALAFFVLFLGLWPSPDRNGPLYYYRAVLGAQEAGDRKKRYRTYSTGEMASSSEIDAARGSHEEIKTGDPGICEGGLVPSGIKRCIAKGSPMTIGEVTNSDEL